MNGNERDRREPSLEDIIEEVQEEHAAGHTGNSALDAMLRARSEAEKTEPNADTLPPVSEFAAREPIQANPQMQREMQAATYDKPEELPAAFQQDISEREEYPAMRSKRTKKKQGSGKAKIAAIVLGIAAAAACAAFGYTYLYSGIHFGVTAGAVKVGGMSLADAQERIDAQAEHLLAGESVTLRIYDKEYQIDIDDVTTGLDSDQSAQDAYDYTHAGSAFTRVGHAVGALFGGHEVPLSVSVDEEAIDKRLDEIAKDALTEPVDPSWTLEEDTMVIDAGKPGVEFDRDEVMDEVTERIRTMNFEAYEVKVQTRAPQKIDVDKIAAEAQAEPKNATVDKTDGKTIVPSVDGVQLDVEEARKIVGDGSKQSYTIPVKRTPAEITADRLAEVLFSDTLASTSTSLNAGNRDRTNNVRLACEHINGTILNPGDEFSYNGVVGERTAARGFKAAGAYANGKVVDEVGGGVCQPSSTLYMAVLRADLEVTERHNHSFTVAYTPLGEDATVSWGGPDFRFKNNTKYPVKIVASQSGSSCNMKIIGTKTSNKTVSLSTDILSTLNYETVEKTDATLAPGSRETSQSGTTGYKTVTYKTITENGKSTTVKANNSYYKKRDKIVLVGPAAPAPAPTPTPTPTPNTEQPAEQNPTTGGDPEAQ